MVRFHETMGSMGRGGGRAEAERALFSFLVRNEALAAAKAVELEKWAEAEGLSAIQALAARGVLGEGELAARLADGLGIPLLDLETTAFDPRATAFLDDDVAVRCTLVPVRTEARSLILAMANPLDEEALRAAEFAAGLEARPAAAPRAQVLAAIDEVYKVVRSLRSLLKEIDDPLDLELVRRPSETPGDPPSAEARGAPIVQMIRRILSDALAANADEIHIEPGPHFVQIRRRVEGVLEDVLRVPKWAQEAVIARLQVVAGLDVSERRLPQDGRLCVRHRGRPLEFRVSTRPADDGETVALRLLGAGTGLERIDEVGLSDGRPAGLPPGVMDVPKALIVDDNDELRKIVRLTLERSAGRIECDEAADGFEALEKIEAGRPHLVLLDLMMPGMDGIEVCKRLRERLSTAFLPVIMLTARADAKSKELGFVAGTDDYVTKPFDRSELVARVYRLLDRTYAWTRADRRASA